MNEASRRRKALDRRVTISLIATAYTIMLVGFIVEFSLLDIYWKIFGMTGLYLGILALIGGICYLLDKQFYRAAMRREP